MPATAKRLTDFLDWLRDGGSGFDAGDQQYLAAQDLLEMMIVRGDWPAHSDSWRTLLAPVVCSSAAQQEHFYELFSTWFGETQEGPVTVAIGRAMHLARSHSRRRRLYLVAGFVALVIALAGGWAWTAFRSGHPNLKGSAPHSGLPGDKGAPPVPEPAARPSRVTLTVRSSAGGDPMSDATIYFGGRVVKTDENGRAALDYRGVPDAKYVLVTRAGFKPKIEELPVADHQVRLSVAQSVTGELPTWWARHHDALVLAAILIPGVVFVAWLAFLAKRTLALRKWTTPLEPRMRRLGLSISGGPLFRGADIRRLAIGLRRRRAEESADLDPGPTAEATSRNAGYFSPVGARRTTEPEYLFLGERKNLRDHLARLHDELIRRLRDYDVAVKRYYFQSDPRVCTDSKGEVYSPGELAAIHPHHELWLALDSNRCINPVSGSPENWWSLLNQWHYRVLLTLQSAPVDLAIRAADPTRQGIEDLALDAGIKRKNGTHYPSMLLEQAERWLDRWEPPPALVSRLVAQLVRYLGPRGYLLLQSCAIYPTLAWNITATLAGQLLEADELEPTLNRVSALPWFRHGMMPDWLRVHLVRGLGANEMKVRAALRKYLDTSSDAVKHKEESLDIVPSRKSAARAEGPIRDYVYLSFVRGRRLDQLSLEPPKGWRRLLRDSIWLRVAGGLVVALVTATGGAFGVDWLGDRLLENEARGRHPVQSPASAFVARMLDVAEALEPLASGGGPAAVSIGEYSTRASDLLNVRDPVALYDSISDVPGALVSGGWTTDHQPQPGMLIFTADSGGTVNAGLLKAVSRDGIQVFGIARKIPAKAIRKVADLNNVQLVTRNQVLVPSPGRHEASAALAGGLPSAIELLGADLKSPGIIDLRVRVRGQGGGIGRLIYRVDGAAPESASYELASKPGQEMQITRTFGLSPGRHEISVTAYTATNLLASPSVSLIVNVPQSDRQAALYLVAVGISNYRDHSLNDGVKFAASDARDLTALLQQRTQGLYNATAPYLLVDNQATRENLTKAIAEIASKIQPTDIFVMYLAGHGTAIEGEYYFVPWGVTYTSEDALKRQSLDTEAIRKLLASIPAKKTLLLLDTCNAGAFANSRGPADKAALSKLSRISGRALLAASETEQMCLEGYEGHGVFTSAVLEALTKAPANERGEIEVSRLADYVIDRVPAITEERWHYEQFPVWEFTGQTFPIARK
jgi:hypothetical protein